MTAISPVPPPRSTPATTLPGVPSPRARVLLVEDDPGVRAALLLGLEDEGYAVAAVGTGAEALARLDASGADVVLLDVALPDLSGIEVCRRLRERTDLPVIMVTGRADSVDVVGGLRAGADDYVTKPVVVAELAARIEALLRRVPPTSTGPTESGRAESGQAPAAQRLELLEDRDAVRCDGREISLTRTEYRLLEVLARHPGRLVSREELLRQVWDADYVGDTRLLDVHASRLRSKLGDDSAAPRHLVTVRGRGYRLDA